MIELIKRNASSVFLFLVCFFYMIYGGTANAQESCIVEREIDARDVSGNRLVFSDLESLTVLSAPCENKRYEIENENELKIVPGRCKGVFKVRGVTSDCGKENDATDSVNDISQSPLNLVSRVPPNVLLILDNAESGQEGLDGRVAIGNEPSDRKALPACQPGTFNASLCPAGARSKISKSSTMKRVGLNLIENYKKDINLGLMAYEQSPPSMRRNAAFEGGTVVWRLTERALDVRYEADESPDWYDEDFSGSWDADTKRYRTKLPGPDLFAFYNVSVPGYMFEEEFSIGLPSNDVTEYWRSIGFTSSGVQRVSRYRYSGFWDNFIYNGNYNLPIVDSMRQRGIPNWGDNVLSLQLNQYEWRSTSSPGLGYLHIPIGGQDDEGGVVEAHWGSLKKKLRPQKHEWDGRGNPLIDPEWPLISAGLTPLEGTMYTATDYFLGETNNFGFKQGNKDFEIPNLDDEGTSQCLVNANIWLTDGLPSVNRSGVPLGSNVKKALDEAEAAIQRLYDKTEKSSRFNEPVKTYVVGFSLPPDVANLFGDGENPLNALAAAGGTERAYLANNEDSLNEVMQQVFGNIIADAQSNTSAASNVNELFESSGAFLYTTSFDSGDWSGKLTAYGLETYGSLSSEEEWSADNLLATKAGERNLLTSKITFDDDVLSMSGHKLNAEITDLDVNEIKWLQGKNVDGLRNRSNLLGDIINSNPRVIPAKEGRAGVVLVGANDGMLHGFDTKTGEELFAYMPAELTLGENPPILELMQPNYTHRYFVDGETTVKEVSIDGEQRVIAVGTMGAGGRTVFALDITDPSSVGPDDVLWEFRHPELGVGVSRAAIAEIDGVPVAIFANGYNSTGYQSSLFMVNLKTGESLIKDSSGNAIPIKAGSGSADTPNGLASPSVLTNSGLAYAGDLKGDMWRFDLKAQSADRLYGGSDERPITSAPALTASNIRPNTTMVLFGTGSYFRNSDTDNIAVQRLIGLQDSPDNSAEITESELLAQKINSFIGTTPDGRFDTRVTSNNSFADGKRGWYLPLDSKLEVEKGERVVSTPVIATDGLRVFFSTLIPDTSDPCAGSRDGYLLNLLVDTGGSGNKTMFDFDRDGEADSDGLLGDNVVSGIKVSSGESVRRIRDTDSQADLLYIGDPTGSTTAAGTDGEPISILYDPSKLGRISWRQLLEEEID